MRPVARAAVLAVLLAGTLAVHVHAHADPLAIDAGDDVGTLLNKYQGKRVTLRLVSGEELTGTVRLVSARLVHISELASREFYDAAVVTTSIAAVIVRTRTQ